MINQERLKVYLSGGFHSGWDLKVMQACGSDCFAYLNPKFGWESSPSVSQEEKEQRSIECYPNYWYVDALAIKKCDIVFCILEDYRPALLGTGTIFELGMAFALGKPAIVVNLVEHRYYRDISKLFVFVKTLDEGIVELLKYKWVSGV